MIPYEEPIKVFCDNRSAISIAHDLVYHDWIKHVMLALLDEQKEMLVIYNNSTLLLEVERIVGREEANHQMLLQMEGLIP